MKVIGLTVSMQKDLSNPRFHANAMSEMLLENQILDTASPRLYFAATSAEGYEGKTSKGKVWLIFQTVGSAEIRTRIILSLEDAEKLASAVAEAVIEIRNRPK